MKDLKSIQWFLNELPRLQNAGVIDSSAAERLREHYSGELKENSLRGLLFTVLGIFAALLIAGSIILFTAHNWDALPKAGRLLITFIPFLLAALFAGFVLIRGKTGVWLEAAALLLTAAIVTLNALVSQIYHIDGSLFDFLALNLPFALVLMYLFNSRVLALIVAIALVQFAITDWSGEHWFPIVCTILWIPFAVPHLRRDSMLIRYAAIPAGIALLCSVGKNIQFLIPLAAAAFLCGGFNLRQTGKAAWFRDPWLQCGFVTVTVYLLIFSTDSLTKIFDPNWKFILSGAIFLAMLSVQLFRHVNALNLLLTLYAVFPFLCSLSPETTELTASGLLILSGALFLIDGVRRADLLLLNLGQLQLYALLAVHFFGGHYTILDRAVAFLTAGIIFLLLNLWLSRRFTRKGGHA